MFLWVLPDTPEDPFNEHRRKFVHFISSIRVYKFKYPAVFPFTAILNTTTQNAVIRGLRNIEEWLYSNVCHISVYLLLKDINIYCVELNMVATKFLHNIVNVAVLFIKLVTSLL